RVRSQFAVSRFAVFVSLNSGVAAFVIKRHKLAFGIFVQPEQSRPKFVTVVFLRLQQPKFLRPIQGGGFSIVGNRCVAPLIMTKRWMSNKEPRRQSALKKIL